MSDTPRTDRHCKEMLGVYEGWCKAEFARQLERELVAAQEQIAALKEKAEEDRLRLLSVLNERDRYRMIAEERRGLRVELEKALGIEGGTGTDDKALKDGLAVIAALKAENERLRELLRECAEPIGTWSPREMRKRIRAALERKPSPTTTPTEDNA